MVTRRGLSSSRDVSTLPPPPPPRPHTTPPQENPVTPSKLKALWTKTTVLVNSFVTYAVAASVGLSAAADAVAELAPEGGETAVAWLLRAVSWLTVAVSIARRVTPVPSSVRGLTPVDEGGA